jgi:hypothetical protein
MLPYWPQLLLFMGAVLLAALYALTASGHFPAEFRGESLKGRPGAVLLWATMLATSIAAVAAIVWAWGSLPWYAAVIGGGAVLLFAPLLLQPLSDSFVNGRRSLIIFSAGAAMLATMLWMAFRAS